MEAISGIVLSVVIIVLALAVPFLVTMVLFKTLFGPVINWMAVSRQDKAPSRLASVGHKAPSIDGDHFLDEPVEGGEEVVADESPGGLEKDNSARFVMPYSEETTIRFECSEFRTLISSPISRMVRFPVSSRDLFFAYTRL